MPRMGAQLRDVHPFHDRDPVRATDRGEPVRDDQTGLAGTENVQAVLDLSLRDAV